MAVQSSEVPSKHQQRQNNDRCVAKSNGLHAAEGEEDKHVIDDEHVQKRLEDQREYVACLKCTNDCSNSSHATASLAHLRLPTAPSFMTVVDDLASTRLEIPQGFAEPFLSRCIGQAKLEGPSGWVWYAPLIRGTDDNHRMLALGSPGWDDFANDHSLQGGDLLVLTYFSIRQLFKVRIFDAAEGVEKSQHCRPSKPHFASLPHHVKQKPTQRMEFQVYDNKAKSLDNSQNHAPISDITKQKDCHTVQFQEPKIKSKSTVSKISTMNCCNCNGEYPKENFGSHIANVKDVNYNLMESNSKIHKHSMQKLTKKTIKPISSSEHDNVVIDHNVKALVPFKRGSDQLLDQKQSVPLSKYEPSFKYLKYLKSSGYNPYAAASPDERERVDREARAFRSKYPFAIKSIPASSIYKDKKLVLPKVFTDVYMPKNEAWMTWVDEEGKQWRCAWLPQRRYNKHVSIVSAGWSAFVNAHHLIEHDICIFELINQDTLHFHVHILKQSLPTDPPHNHFP